MSGCVSVSGFVCSRLLNVGLPSGGHADFSSTESFLEFQMAQFPSKRQAVSSGIAEVFLIPPLWRMDPRDGPYRTQSRVRVRA